MNLYKRLLDEFYDTAMATPITNIFNPAYAASTTARPTLETINEENNQENALQEGSNDLASVVDDQFILLQSKMTSKKKPIVLMN